MKSYFEYMSQIDETADAICIVNNKGIVEYSAVLSDKDNTFVNEGITGRYILDVYPSLTVETSSHFRVLKSGKPIVNETQTLTDFNGNTRILRNSTYPIYVNDQLIGTFETSSFVDDEDSAEADKEKKLFSSDDIIANNPKMKKLKKLIKKLGPTEESVLITGETGTGKELFAQALHYHGLRPSGPFVTVNAAAIPEHLIESTLFGAKKGSYTGATEQEGLMQEAHGGTLFLDELNSMSMHLQSKLLRAIETKTIRPLGASEDVEVDVRFISAMNCLPDQAVRDNTLRADLYFRLAATQLHIPPLRERIDDLEVLSKSFIGDQCDISPMVIELLKEYRWPGNVRELKNIMGYAKHMATSGMITIQDIPEYLILNNLGVADLKNGRDQRSLADRTAEFEKEIIEETLRETRTLTEASERLQLTRQALKYKMNKYNISK